MPSYPFQDLLERNSPDPRARLDLAPQLMDAIAQGQLVADTTLLMEFTDIMRTWLSGSNFKVALAALEILSTAVDALGESYTSFLLDGFQALSDRLGDARDVVRQETQALILKLMASPGASPQTVLDKLTPNGFTHKQWLVRIGCMQTLQNALRAFGGAHIQLNRVTPLVCKLIGDANSQVRDCAADTLVEMFIRSGDKLERDIQQRRLLPDNKTAASVLSRFNEARNAGLLHIAEDSVDRAAAAPLFQNRQAISMEGAPTQMQPKRLQARAGPGSGVSSVGSRARTRPPPTPMGPALGGAGAIGEAEFVNSFEDVKPLRCPTLRDLHALLETHCTTLSNTAIDWDKRVQALKGLRALLVAGAADDSEFVNELRLKMKEPMEASLRDLRSQVVREACVTVAFYAKRLGLRFEAVAEHVFGAVVLIVQNSAKIMATSGRLALLFILRHIHSPRLLPTLSHSLSSKSKDIRAAVADAVCTILHNWPAALLERNMTMLSDAIKTCLCDASPECRSQGRRAYSQLAAAFPTAAEVLFQSLDPSKQRQLRGDMSASSSIGSIAQDYGMMPSSSRGPMAAPGGLRRDTFVSKRSTSDIDAGSARKALLRRNLHARRQPALIRDRKPPPSQQNSQENPSLSQPGSRSTSPSSKASGAGLPGQVAQIPRRHSRTTPRSTSVRSRDASPSRPGRRRVSGAMEDDRSSVGSSLSGYAPPSDPDLVAVLKAVASTQASDRRDGLLSLRGLVSERVFSQPDLRRITDTLNRLFVDTHSKTFSLFLDVVVDLLATHRHELHDWLYVLLTRLVVKKSQDGPCQDKLARTLRVVQESFPYGLQLNNLVRYILDPAQTPQVRAKVTLLNYMQELTATMDGSDLQNDSDTRQAVTKILSWINDPRGGRDLTLVGERVILSLFTLNPATFTAMLNTFPRATSDQVHSLLQKRLNKPAEQEQRPSPPRISPNSYAPPPTYNGTRHPTHVPNGPSAVDSQQEDLMASILTELSNHNERNEQRTAALASLRTVTRDGSFDLWDEHFRSVLFILLETVFDKSRDVRVAALRALKEVVLAQSQRCSTYAELMILKILECHTTSDKEVARYAEDVASAAAASLPCEKTLPVIIPIIRQQQYEVLLPSLKMCSRVLSQLDPDAVAVLLPDILPGLLLAYEHKESSVRKAAVVCLVTLHQTVGPEDLTAYLQTLPAAKLRLLQLYIDRAGANETGSER